MSRIVYDDNADRLLCLKSDTAIQIKLAADTDESNRILNK